MKSLNRVFLIGHLGHTPELSQSKAGKPYTRLNLATHRRWVTGEEEKKEATDWHSVFVWGPLAEHCVHYLRKGALVFVEGALTYWKVVELGHYKNAIHADEIKFLNLPSTGEGLDNPEAARNHDAVAHPA